MKRTLTNIFLLSVYLISEHFFDLVSYKYEANDIITVLSVIFVFFNFKEFIQFIRKHYNIVIFLLFLFVENVITSAINYNQPIFFSFKAGRFLITYILIAFVAFEFSLKNRDKISFIPLIIPLIIIGLNYYAFLTGDFHLFANNIKVSERFYEVRFMVAGTSVIYLVLYYSNRLKEKPYNPIIFLLLLSVIVVISKTRGIIFPILITLLFSRGIVSLFKSLIRLKKSGVYVFFIFVVALLFFGSKFIFNLKSSFFSTINGLQSGQINNIQIRFLSYAYYWNIIKQSFLSVLFGNGIPTIFTINRFNPKFFISDIGYFGVLFDFGIVGIIIILQLLIAPLRAKYKIIKQELILTRDFKLFFIFQLFSMVSMTFFFKTPAVIFFFIIYMKQSRFNDESRYSNNQL